MTTETICPRCGEVASRSFSAVRRPGLWVGISITCAACRYAVEIDDDQLSEVARYAFYAAEGKWALHLRDLGTRRTEALQALRLLRNEGVGEVLRFIKTDAPILEGTLVEVEHAEAQLEAVGASTERRRCAEDDPDMMLARNRARPIEERLRAHAQLWSTDLARYVLEEVGGNPHALAIFDVVTGSALVVDEDEDVYDGVIRRMRAAGVPTRRTWPARKD